MAMRQLQDLSKVPVVEQRGNIPSLSVHRVSKSLHIEGNLSILSLSSDR